MIKRLTRKLLPSRKVVVFALVCTMLIASSSSAVYSAARNVSISDGQGIERSLVTFETQVGKLLEKEGITLLRGDKMNVTNDQHIENNMSIEIYRAMPVTVTANGKSTAYLATKHTAADILRELGFALDDDDIVLPSRMAEITDGGNIEFIDVSFDYITESEEIPYEVAEELNDGMSAGERTIVQNGEAGESSVTYRIRYENGAEVSRERIEETVVKEPQTEIRNVGTKVSAAFASGGIQVLRGGSGHVDLAKCRSIIADATAYDNSFASVGKKPGDRGYGVTASGMPCGVGVIAVDPKVIPLGTKLYVEAPDASWSYGYCVAGDTGGAIKGNKIDLFFNTSAECRSFGRRKAKVYIIE